MDKAITNAIEVNAECHEAVQEALEEFTKASREEDKLRYLQAGSDVLATWLRNKKMVECAHLQLLAAMVELSPEDYGGEEYLTKVRRRMAKAEASLNDLC